MEQAKVPELRFRQEDGTEFPAWRKTVLQNTAKITMGQSPNGETYSETPNGYILVQGNADLANGWVAPRIWTSEVTRTASAGDFIMSVRAPVGAMGKTAFDVVLGRGVAGIKGNEFIYQMMCKMDSDGYWSRKAAGSTFESITSKDLKTAEVMIPNLQEQEKLGDFFSAMDHRIALADKKLATLQTLKKGMLQKIFSQELRFKDDDGNEFPAWKKMKIKQIGKFYSGTGFSEKYQGHTDLPIQVYKVSDMNNIGNDVYMNTANNTIDSEISKLMKATVISNQCIIFAKVGAAIYVERKRIAYKPFVIDNNMMAFAPKDSCLEFVYYLFSSIHFSKYAQVGALPSYNASDIGAIKISMPSLAEQQKIAAYFTALDRSIAAAQKKAEALRIIKKGLLQKMFI